MIQSFYMVMQTKKNVFNININAEKPTTKYHIIKLTSKNNMETIKKTHNFQRYNYENQNDSARQSKKRKK